MQNNPQTLKEAQDERDHLKLDRDEIFNRVIEGDFVRWEDVLLCLGTALVNLRTKLVAIGIEFTEELDRALIEGFRQEIYQALNEAVDSICQDDDWPIESPRPFKRTPWPRTNGKLSRDETKLRRLILANEREAWSLGRLEKSLVPWTLVKSAYDALLAKTLGSVSALADQWSGKVDGARIERFKKSVSMAIEEASRISNLDVREMNPNLARYAQASAEISGNASSRSTIKDRYNPTKAGN